MAVSTSVKWAVSSMVGAPTLNGTAGSLIALLDAFLVNGFGTKAVDSAQVTGGVCRMAITGASAAQDHCVIQLAGVIGGGVALNGLQRVKTATASYVEFACDLPDGPLTGTITFKIAPLGWEKVFSGTNLAVYRSVDVTGTRMYLRVDDSEGANARVVGYEHMRSLTDGDGPFPTAVQVAGGGYWPKASTATASARAWTVVGDSKAFTIHMHTAGASGESGCVWSFGDFKADKSGDTYACMLQCASADVAASTQFQTSAVEYASPSSGVNTFLPRSFTGVGSAINAGHGCESHVEVGSVAGTANNPKVPQYPNPANNSLCLTRKLIFERNVSKRGIQRGVRIPVHMCYMAFAWQDKLVDPETGDVLMAIKCGSPAGTSAQGVIFLAITGDWE